MSKQITLTLKEKLTHRADLSPLLPEALDNLPLAKISKLKINSGKKRIAIEKLFDIEVEESDTAKLIFKKSSPLFDNIGQDMNGGSIEIKGATGDNLGRDMTNGSIKVKGDVGQFAGTGMKNSKIEINGNAGDFLGGALPGAQQGLRSGTIHVTGDAGDRIGDRMRRGMIIVEGDAGDYCGSRLTAGTIMVCGKAGKAAGFGMKRGTIILTDAPESLPTTFNDCGEFELAFLQLIFNSLAKSSRRLKVLKDYSSWVQRYAGDMGSNGQGEVLVLL